MQVLLYKEIIIECSILVLSVGPKTIKIETNLSFDDEQNEEMKSVMISVREIKCKST